MAVPRKFIVDESCSSTYHCVSRTVRQAFLLAPDREESDPGRSAGSPNSPDSPGPVDNHRRDWILERIRFQAQIFAVDCISLAVMSNHLHLLLRILPEVVESWSAFEVAHRWLLLRPRRALRQAMGVDLSLPPLESEVATVVGDAQLIARLRGRLALPSWYMKELKEWIARRGGRQPRGESQRCVLGGAVPELPGAGPRRSPSLRDLHRPQSGRGMHGGRPAADIDQRAPAPSRVQLFVVRRESRTPMSSTPRCSRRTRNSCRPPRNGLNFTRRAERRAPPLSEDAMNRTARIVRFASRLR